MNFVELTDVTTGPMLVNLDLIILIKPSSDGIGSMLSEAGPSDINGYFLTYKVLEPIDQIKEIIKGGDAMTQLNK